MRRILATFCAVAVGVFCARCKGVDLPHYVPSERPSSVLVSFADGADTRGFAWQTSTNVAESLLFVVGNGTTKKLSGSVKTVNDPALNCHKAVATGLKPGRYEYRVGGAGHFAEGAFEVRPGHGAVTILNFNDAQTKDARKLSMWETTCKAARHVVGRKADFIIDGGDHHDGKFRNATNVVYGMKFGQYLQWGIATDVSVPYFPGVPWAMVSGNHDYQVYGEAVAENWAIPKLNGCHSFDYGNVHVATVPWINAGWNHNHDKMMRWLDEDLARANAAGKTDWTILAMHLGPYTTGDNTAYEKFQTNFVQRIGALCAKRHVDLVLQAHDHTFSKTLPYRWDAAGWTSLTNDDSVVNLCPDTVVVGGETYDSNPKGTYYVSAGCAGHRVGECGQWADINGEKSYWNRSYRTYIGKTISGENASADLNKSMFGVIRIEGRRLAYDFYTVEADGRAKLHDKLRVQKTLR